LDSHANTIVGGANCILLDMSGETLMIHSLSNERNPFSDVPIGTVALSWVDPERSEVIVFVFNKGLLFNDCLYHTLICPNKPPLFGAVVNNTPW
jgi:hypothetical protein